MPPEPIYHYSEFYEDKTGEIVSVTIFVPEERENLIKMYEDYSPEKRCCGLPPVTRKGIETWIDGLHESGYGFIAKLGDRVVGHIAVVPVKDEAEFAVFIHQDFENRGIGSELIRFASKFLKERGVKKLKAVTERTNRRAVETYRHLGFEIVSYDPQYLFMEKRL
ncbi:MULTISPECIES: GNAT family N-acetyltransferase [unclassified Archaeoglobus]|jgi:ribosomal protein S18 acetylase RimI-like enzyme|uniref:GNAT family N-acetyltransferase n=1 Tax=unclassified Archaeoglobus TaxID=2643606 RepID=UPI0025C3D822|nr:MULTISPECIES: GNAT family N-acetyltransferase [unclassified Archaeoglobus]